ncbi:hypothetical protein K3495_g2466 [Podosphaera aphanis]|nr:hypothetical protein K3495_g2466 [Podosphaera aphanis]
MPIVATPSDPTRFIIFVILIVFLYTSSNTPSSISSSRALKIAHNALWLKDSLRSLNTTRWQEFSPQGAPGEASGLGKYLNLTGFRETDRYPGWERFEVWRETCMLLTQQAVGRAPKSELEQNAIYSNITGVVYGNWVRHEGDLAKNSADIRPKINLSDVTPDVNWDLADNELWSSNITGKSGSIRLQFEEKSRGWHNELLESEVSTGLARNIVATITLQDKSHGAEEWEIRVYGVHWPRTGAVIMTTTSEKFSGIFGLPHLTLNLDQFTSSQKLLHRTLEKIVNDVENDPGAEHRNSWGPKLEIRGEGPSRPHCDFVIFAQVHPFPLEDTFLFGNKDAQTIVKDIEDELRFPNGAPLPKVPRLQISTAILSPDCGFILESQGPPRYAAEDGDHLVGKKQEIIIKIVRHWLEIFTVIVFSQTLLLKAQSKQASTPSTVGRVSLYTISMMLFFDAFIFACLSLLSGTSPNIFPSALLVSFMSLMSIMLEIRFVSAIWNSQEPERRDRDRQIQATQAASMTASMQPNSTSRIIPPTVEGATSSRATGSPVSRPDENPIIIPSDQDIDAEIHENSANDTSNANANQTVVQSRGVSFAAMYIYFIMLLTLILALTLLSTSWPAWLRTTYIYCLSLTYLSFPTFQIYRNIQRNCRKALLWKFVIGQSAFRLTPFAYLYLVEDNILFVERDAKAFYVLFGWVWIQCWLLVAQNILGPRWGLPKTWYDEAWDYHPIIRDDNIEAGSDNLPIGLAQIQKASMSAHTPSDESFDSSALLIGGTKESSTRSVDCTICMQLLEVPVLVAGSNTSSGGVPGILERRRYMVTPCRHIFHSKCLEGWMRFRLQCPICRENLPPL